MRKEKTLLLDEIKEKVDASKAMIVLKYNKLEPNASWELREALAKSGGFLEVVQKRVFMKALEMSNIEIDGSQFEGHIGAVFVGGEDSTPCIKDVFDFSKNNGDIFKMIAGMLDGKVVPGSDLEILAKLPGMNDMRATMLGLFTAPMSQLLSVMQAKCEKESSSADQS